MIRPRDHEWLPFWRYVEHIGPIHRDLGWVVSVRHVGRDGRPAISATRPSRWRLVALWRGLRADVR